MSNLCRHALYASAGLAFFSLGKVATATFGVEKATAAMVVSYLPEATTSAAPGLFAGLAFIAGSLLPDIGNTGYQYGARTLGLTGLNIWDKRTWKSRDFEQLNITKWSIPYKLCHSLPVLLVFFLLLLPLADAFGAAPVLCWYCLGYLCHICMDHYTHSISYILWPCIPAIASPDKTWDWFHEKYVAMLSERNEWLIAVGCTFIFTVERATFYLL